MLFLVITFAQKIVVCGIRVSIGMCDIPGTTFDDCYTNAVG